MARRLQVMRRHTAERITTDAAGAKVSLGTVQLASATLLRTTHLTRIGPTTTWQKEVWDLYNDLPEIHYGTTWFSSACSRARLYTGLVDPDGSAHPSRLPDEHDPAARPLQELCGGQSGQSEALRRWTLHLNLPGESFLVGYDHPDPGPDGQTRRVWQVASANEIQPFGIDRIQLHLPDEDRKIELDLDGDGPSRAQVMRIWRPHPDIAWQADSPMRPLREPCYELMDITARIRATLRSRMAGPGIFFMPDTMRFSGSHTVGEGGINPAMSDEFTALLQKAMSAAIKDLNHPSALVPIVVTGPPEAGQQMKHITFASDVDGNLIEQREAATKRIAIGLDIPPEVLTGTGDVNHWGAWQINENAIQLHIEPMLQLICDALTTQFLRPALEALKVPDPEKYCVWYDITDLKQRPDRGPEAMQAREAGLLSDAAALREIGFAEEDQRTDEEKKRDLLTKVALAVPNLAPVILPEIGADVPGLDDCNTCGLEQQTAGGGTGVPGRSDAGDAESGPVTELPPAPNPPALPGPPQRSDGRDGQRPPLSLQAACEIAVYRALRRAGQWLMYRGGRSLRGQLRAFPDHEIHTVVQAKPDQIPEMLDGAFTELHLTAPEAICAHYAVEDYVRALLLAGEKHRTAYLRAALMQAECEDDGRPVLPAGGCDGR